MKLSTYVYIWIFISALIGVEYYNLNHQLEYSFLNYLKVNVPAFANLNLTTHVGKTISYYLGWMGLSTMFLTNFYLMRKRYHFLNKLGKLSNWLNFHIFCGLMGPTLIVFHTDFKVGGLVAISFYSMMTVALSGIVGRYFYVKILRKKSEIRKSIQHFESLIQQMLTKVKVSDVDSAMKQINQNIAIFIGVPSLNEGPSEKVYSFFDLIFIFLISLIGDVKSLFTSPKTLSVLPKKQSQIILNMYASEIRRDLHFLPFQTLLGYWHSFHVPFTVIMYIVAVIHVIVALIFQVK